MSISPVLLLVGVVMAASQLTGCAPVLGVGLGTGALMVEDRRSTGTYLTDEGIELRSIHRFTELERKDAHVSFTSFNRRVLVTGQVPDNETRVKATEIARMHPDVLEVINELAIGEPTTLKTRSNDGFTTAKVKTRLLDDKRISAHHIKVVTEDGTVYLMGLVRKEEGQIAAEIAAKTKGAEKVVKVFEYMD